jgi:chitodextrinase
MKAKIDFISVFIIFIAMGFAYFAHAQIVGVTFPSVPTGLIVSASSPLEVSISWSASAESSGTLEGYYIYRNGAQVGTTAGTSFIDAGASSGLYNYTVAAYDANGYVSNQSAVASITLVKDVSPPTSPTGVTISGVTSTNSYDSSVPLTVSWTASTDNVGVAGYYVYRNGVRITSSTSAFTGTSITDAVGPGTYSYVVTAYDAAQNFSSQSAAATTTVSVDTVPPSIPRSLFAQQVSGTGIDLSWATSSDSIGVAGYQVFRNSSQIATVAGPAYADSGLSTGVSYSYSVTAYDNVGNVSLQSSPIQVTVETSNGPSAPYLSAPTLVGTSTVDLSWAVTGGDPLAITGYTVYRNGSQIASLTSTNYMDMRLASGTYIYNVSESDVSGAQSVTSSPEMIIVTGVLRVSAISALSIFPLAITPTVVNLTSSSFSQLLTQSLYLGLRDLQVNDLQSLLVNSGYLSSTNVTGLFGNLTLGAVEKFQCARNIVCTGGAGWGIVGPKTRAMLNGLQSSAATASSSLSEQVQSLEALLAGLEQQLLSSSSAAILK